jgi:hypothetical protein
LALEVKPLDLPSAAHLEPLLVAPLVDLLETSQRR